ncbi:hypothetical protein QYE76_031095 [Lolium multiflorum]|uniref:Integrase catalytic domain-containing protein n=1 Tax=Lolium multiflorum TaxID=4521 RepID=A0AAD8QTF2_LOLMU|nr:hypothetical protein QYE76_031095 [Lolium multiflorum]
MEKDEYVPAEVFPEPRGQVSMIHKTSFSKREIKKFSREVKYAEVAMVDTPEFIDWSEQSISFDRIPRHYTDETRVLSRKNVIDVVFGTPTNFRREKIEFEAVDWESQYHAILGRPAFAKFMAIPHYAYLKLKMPGNNGTPITIHGSFARSDTCDREFQKIASKFGAKEELNAIDAAVDHTHHQPTTEADPTSLLQNQKLQIGRNIEVYIDDIVVKTKHTATLVDDLRETFDNLDSIVTDNGTNFDSKEFREFCDDRGIKLKFASVAHPQTNGQVERINGLIGDGLKKRLTGAEGAWVEELPSVLWSLRTTPNRSTQYTPFFLVHGAEAVLPADVRFEAPRVTAYTEPSSNIALQDAVDLLDEARDIALARTTVYQQALRNTTVDEYAIDASALEIWYCG